MKKLCLMLMIYRALSYLYSKLKKASKTTFLLVVKVGEKNNRIREEILQAFNRRNVSLL